MNAIKESHATGWSVDHDMGCNFHAATVSCGSGPDPGRSEGLGQGTTYDTS